MRVRRFGDRCRVGPYIAGWAGEEEPAKVVREAAEAIDTLARLIEDALTPQEHEEGEAA